MMRSDLEAFGHHHPAADTWELRFPWKTNPLPMNGSHGGWRKHARTARGVREHGALLARVAGIPPMGRCTAQITWWVSSSRVRDPDNLADLEKRLFDALVDAGVVADDRPELMVKPRALIRHIADSDGLLTMPCFTLTVTRTEEPA